MRPYFIIPRIYRLQENTLAFLEQQMRADLTMPMPMPHTHTNATILQPYLTNAPLMQ